MSVNINTGFNSGHMGDKIVVDNSRSGLDELPQILTQIQDLINRETITEEDRKEVEECLSVIKKEAEQNDPRTDRIKSACEVLKKIIVSPHFVNLVDKVWSHFLK